MYEKFNDRINELRNYCECPNIQCSCAVRCVHTEMIVLSYLNWKKNVKLRSALDPKFDANLRHAVRIAQIRLIKNGHSFIRVCLTLDHSAWLLSLTHISCVEFQLDTFARVGSNQLKRRTHKHQKYTHSKFVLSNWPQWMYFHRCFCGGSFFFSCWCDWISNWITIYSTFGPRFSMLLLFHKTVHV